MHPKCLFIDGQLLWGQARVYLLIGDAQFSLGQQYEALLAYAKAEKKVKDSPLAYEAKWKTSKAYFYSGDN